VIDKDFVKYWREIG